MYPINHGRLDLRGLIRECCSEHSDDSGVDAVKDTLAVAPGRKTSNGLGAPTELIGRSEPLAGLDTRATELAKDG